MNLQTAAGADSARLAAQAANPLIANAGELGMMQAQGQPGLHAGLHSGIALPAIGRHLPEPARAPLVTPASAPAVDGAIGRHDIPIDELGFRALTTTAEIDSIKYLRGELSLARAVVADPQFTMLEKKETSTGWSVRSHFPIRSSAQ